MFIFVTLRKLNLYLQAFYALNPPKLVTIQQELTSGNGLQHIEVGYDYGELTVNASFLTSANDAPHAKYIDGKHSLCTTTSSN